MHITIAGAVLAILAIFDLHLAAAQQYAGDVIPNGLPNVPGSELTYFRVNDPSGKNKNLTLINYYTHQDNGRRIVESQIKRAVVIIHGLNRDPGTYASNMMSALAQLKSDANINRSTVAIMAPYFTNGDDKTFGYPWTEGLSPGRGSTSNCLVWKSSQWSAGGNNQYPYTSKNTSSYTILDQIIQYFDNTSLFPNMKQIVIAGHSLGAQTVQRYAAIGQSLNTKAAVSYWVGNPNSYIWLSLDRPLATASCPTYDEYREGYTSFVDYPMTYGVNLVNSGRANVLANFNSKAINFARGTQDLGDDSSSCAPGTTGNNRNERLFNFIKAFPPSCWDSTSRNCDTVDFVNVGHDGGAMMASPAGQARLFTDNFYGTGNRSYDFGYPRQQAGDDPLPNPALNSTAASINNNTYAGNMTYWGCWSDQDSRSLANLSYTSNDNTIEKCTAVCAQGGNTIAGIEFGTQCFCGSALSYQATQVIDSSCSFACPGNGSEICGGSNRLSLFSNGRPMVLAPPGTPETIGDFDYASCYTEATSGRALAGKGTSGRFMTLQYCGSFCSGYKYFGVEFGSECYCGNSFAAGATITNDNDCNMLCANDTAEFCGAANRLTVYQDPDWTAPTAGGPTPTTTTTGSNVSPSGIACPTSNNTVVVSNGKNFAIECGIDHAGGDLTSTNVNSFQACIDACAQNSRCVDVSLAGVACYLKSTLGTAVANGGISGARLITTISDTTPSPTGATTSKTSSSNTPISTSVSCPGSNSTTYTASNGAAFLIECGIDHFAGDMSNKDVNSLAECIEACSITSGCVDVSLAGSSCYLKSSVGRPVYNGVFGARLVSTFVTTSSMSSSTSTDSKTSSPASSSSITLVTGTQTTAGESSTSSSSSRGTTFSDGQTTTTGATTDAQTHVIVGTPDTQTTQSPIIETVTSIGETSTAQTSTSQTSTSSNPGSSDTPSSTPTTATGGVTDAQPTQDQTTGTGTSTDELSSLQTLTDQTASGQTSTDQTTSGQTSVGQTTTSQTSSVTSSLGTSQTTLTSFPTTLSTSTFTSSTQATSTASSSLLPSGFSSLGCFKDNLSGRPLPHSNGSSSTQTPQQCALNCQRQGYKFSGVEYGRECYCGNEVPANSVPATDCKMKCSGDSKQMCGAGNRLSVVRDDNSQQTFFIVPIYNTWELMTCFVDSTKSRLLKSGVSLKAYGGDANATVENCVSACAGKGYRYCGVEYYAECYGSNTEPPTSAIALGGDEFDAGCNYPCKGNPSEACGGSNRILVYFDHTDGNN